MNDPKLKKSIILPILALVDHAHPVYLVHAPPGFIEYIEVNLLDNTVYLEFAFLYPGKKIRDWK